MTDELLFAQHGHFGLITLNRPQALNALTLPMICAWQQQLKQWQVNPSIKAVMVESSSSSAFCAGGDVRWLYQNKENPEQQRQFFWHEYQLNHLIHSLGKPYIPLLDGLTMGGGVGISLHGSHPIASEQFSMAMPETGIGFFPDVGASYLFNRTSQALGRYLGLTGARLDAPQAYAAGFIKYYVPAAQMSLLKKQLLALDLTENIDESIEACLNEYHQAPVDADKVLSQADNYFQHDTVEEIIASLERIDANWEQQTLHALLKKSPLSLKVTLAQLHKTHYCTLQECLAVDFNLVQHFMQEYDFYEGVRALLIDKDKNPQWQPADLAAVTKQQVEDYFKPITPFMALF